jgi:hypothetical protein
VAAETFDGEVGCKEMRLGRRVASLISHNKYINTNNEKDNIIVTVIMFQYISKITNVLNAGQPFLFYGFPVFLGIPFVPVIASSAAIPVGV